MTLTIVKVFWTIIMMMMMMMMMMVTLETVNGMAVPKASSSSSSSSRSGRRSSAGSRKNSFASPSKTKTATNIEWYQRRQKRTADGGGNGSSSGAKSSSSSSSSFSSSRRRGPKPPQWEREGDALYSKEIQFIQEKEETEEGEAQDDRSTAAAAVAAAAAVVTSIEQAYAMLRPFGDPPPPAEAESPSIMVRSKSDSTGLSTVNNDEKDDNDENEKPFLWGGLSVGPVWKHRLVQAGYIRPTPIQTASFDALAKGSDSVVVAASTGSGKSLAFLLPFLTRGTKSLGRIWIVTPTMELAFQLQRTVDRLILGPDSDVEDDANADDNKNEGMIHVLQNLPSSDSEGESSSSSSYPILSRLKEQCQENQEPFFLAATPKLFRQLQREMDRVRKDEDWDDVVRLADRLDQNLETVVFDEADRLFQTEKAVAWRAATKTSGKTQTKNSASQSPKRTAPPLGVQLLESLSSQSQQPRTDWWQNRHRSQEQGRRPGAVSYRTPIRQSRPLQVVAVSATVGRSLRRQLMISLKKPSIDAAAQLVTEDVRTKKNADARRSSLLPSNLKHAYRLVEDEAPMGPKAGGTTEEEDPQRVLCESLVETIRTLEPAPTLIFPGRLGVETVQSYLRQVAGFQDVRGLSSLSQPWCESSSGSSSGSTNNDWATTPIYVIKERLGRGLDLPHVRTVLMVNVPSSAAAYMHLAGRTARNNIPGTAITLCRPSEARRLATNAQILGLRLESIG